MSYLKILTILLISKAIFLSLFIIYGPLGLGPDEAQYWTWSQALDWGYYSKPPGIAWQIWLGTKIFGQNVFGVRFFSIIFSYLQAMSVYYLALACGLQLRTAFWAAIVMAFSPIGVVGSLFAITDGGLLLFWTLACISLTSALTQQRAPNPIQIGAMILGGALFKWPIYLFWPFYFLFRRLYFPSQPLSKGLLGILLSLGGLLPSIWWNFSHQWATFRHVGATVQGEGSHGNLLEFLGSQILLLSPIWFGLFAWACYIAFKRYRTLSPALQFCVITTCTLLGALLIASLFQKIQGNWGVFVYPTAIILLCWHVCEAVSARAYWLKWGAGLSAFLLVFLISSLTWWPHRLSPFKHNLGWDNLKNVLVSIGYDPKEHFLVSDKYQTTSILSFYNKGQKRAYFLNLQGTRKNQFSYWPGIQEQQGKTGFFVWVENAPHLKNWVDRANLYEKELREYFKHVEFLGINPLLTQRGQVVKAAFIFTCEDSLQIPADPNRY